MTVNGMCHVYGRRGRAAGLGELGRSFPFSFRWRGSWEWLDLRRGQVGRWEGFGKMGVD